MAKKKQKKEKEKFEYSEEILGVLIVLICVIGILGYGRAGNFFRSFAVFLTGICYAPFLIILLILGLYLIVKRKMPDDIYFDEHNEARAEQEAEEDLYEGDTEDEKSN